ncbi:Alpha/Beta hydrolase protein [Rhexocercosporidium sp. MPI-PUGE-AT-0058]|nr:Alpha/Beta hydrolase protein [Rhexocercosporidium sp. MPI-PUGE-AT-0058]
MGIPSQFLGLALYAASLAHAAGNWTVGQVVDTSSGSVTGHAASINTEVSEYLGIPFAQPPVGDLRWTAPQAYNSTNAINGTDFGFSCPAGSQVSPDFAAIQAANITSSGLQILASLGQIGDKFSEDCLTLNVWTKPQVGESKKAVLVWIYGGGFTTGNSDNVAYNGQYIADQEDVVLVSFNYRLNVFGFPGYLNGTKNLGLLDQRLAIEWVRDNIEKFGGDPSRITLFGQSAGSASVDYHTFAWADDPIAHSFIQQSGSVLGPSGGLGAISKDTAAGYWYAAATVLNCGDKSTDPAELLACMKSKSYEDVLKAIAEGARDSAIASSFGPTVDDTIVFSNYTQLAIEGKFSKLPLLLGNADYEAGLFRVLDSFRNATNSDVYYEGFNNLGFVCPGAQRAAYSIANDVPTWRYRWFGAFPNTQLTTVPYSGAWHSSELPVLFNNPPTGGAIPNNTEAEIAIGSYMRGAWATFAKNPVDGLSSYQGGWPQYVPGEDTLVRLAYQNMTGANLALGRMYDGGCKTNFAGGNGTAGNSTGSGSPTSSASPSSGSSAPARVATSGGSETKSLMSGVFVSVILMLMGCL